MPTLLPALRGMDIAHLHFPFYGGSEHVLRAHRRFGLPYVLTYHMDVIGTHWLKRAVVAINDHFVLGPVLRHAASITAPGLDYLRTTKAAAFVEESRLAAIPHAGVDCNRFCPGTPPPDLVARYGLKDKTVILFVGNLLELKGVDLLIQALATIDDPSIVLLVVGGGYQEEQYRRLVTTLGLEERVIFAGARERDTELPDHFRLADVCVLPSRRSESFGLVLLEAMASGLPVITSDLPGPRQLVRDHQTGRICRAGDAQDLRACLMDVLRDPERHAAMGRAARRLANDTYSWSAWGDQLEAMLLDVATGERLH